MPQCPQCKKDYVVLPRHCLTCRADLDLLVDYVKELHDGLSQAQQHTRAGELDRAVWAYLSVLEVEPDNPEARRQVGKVVTAVRQFDRTAPGRRWLLQFRGEQPYDGNGNSVLRWLVSFVFLIVIALATFSFGVLFGSGQVNSNPEESYEPPRRSNTITGK